METQNLEWLIFNALHGDVNGDIPEDLQVMIKAEQEFHALRALRARVARLEEALNEISTLYWVDAPAPEEMRRIARRALEEK